MHLLIEVLLLYFIINRIRILQAQECYDCREYYCGIDAITKGISLLTSAGCARDSCNFYKTLTILLVNWCCFLHDTCYDRNKFYIPYMRGCDYQFGDCIQFFYQSNPLCANW